LNAIGKYEWLLSPFLSILIVSQVLEATDLICLGNMRGETGKNDMTAGKWPVKDI
jgi:hypothetical protein